MFGLIPMVITIILAAIVAGAFAYFGGDIYSDSSISAKANGYVNEGSQIRSAAQLYRVSNAAWPGDVATLVTDTYLGGSPTHVYTIDGTTGKIAAVSTETANGDLTVDVCAKIQDAAIGVEDPTEIAGAEQTGQLFGCYASVAGTSGTTPASGDMTFFHK